MGKWKGGPLGACSAKHGVMRDPAERQDHAKLRQSRDSGCKELLTICDLRERGLILERHATNGIGNQAGNKLQPVIARGNIVARGKAKIDDRRKEVHLQNRR